MNADNDTARLALQHLEALRDVQMRQLEADDRMRGEFQGFFTRLEEAMPIIAKLQDQVLQLQTMLLDLCEEISAEPSSNESLYWTANRILGQLRAITEEAALARAVQPAQD
jgi:hypothetical protein